MSYWDLVAEHFERFRHAASVLHFEDEAIRRIERVGDLTPNNWWDTVRRSSKGLYMASTLWVKLLLGRWVDSLWLRLDHRTRQRVSRSKLISLCPVYQSSNGLHHLLSWINGRHPSSTSQNDFLEAMLEKIASFFAAPGDRLLNLDPNFPPRGVKSFGWKDLVLLKIQERRQLMAVNIWR